MNHFYQEIDGYSSFDNQGELMKFMLPGVEMKSDPSDRFRMAEIGVYKGRCTAMWNVMIRNWLKDSKKFQYGEYYAIDHFQGSEEHCKGIDYYHQTLNNLAPLLELNSDQYQLSIINNDSVSQSSKYPDKHFDIVYIDASHDYHSVCADIDAWLPKVKPGGFLCGDDYTDGWLGVQVAVNDRFANKERRFHVLPHTSQWFHIV